MQCNVQISKWNSRLFGNCQKWSERWIHPFYVTWTLNFTGDHRPSPPILHHPYYTTHDQPNKIYMHLVCTLFYDFRGRSQMSCSNINILYKLWMYIYYVAVWDGNQSTSTRSLGNKCPATEVFITVFSIPRRYYGIDIKSEYKYIMKMMWWYEGFNIYQQ